MHKHFAIFSTEKGFFEDFIEISFSETVNNAKLFETRTEAEKMRMALQEIDKIEGLEIVPIDADLPELLELARYTVMVAEMNAIENPKPEKIQIVIVEPDKKPYKKIISNELEIMQKIVGGYIESVTIGENDKGGRIALTINEEGKLLQLPLNRRILGFDFLVGTFFISAYNLEGDAISLTDHEADFFIKKFTPVEVYI